MKDSERFMKDELSLNVHERSLKSVTRIRSSITQNIYMLPVICETHLNM